MTNEKIKRMFDACYQAKRIREMLPPLPPEEAQQVEVVRGPNIQPLPVPEVPGLLG